MFWDRRTKVSPAVLAQQFMVEFVDKPIYQIPEGIQVPPETVAAINSKARLFQFACVMMAVMVEEQKSRAYTPLRTELERLFLPPTFAQGANMLDELRTAMRDLNDLMTPRQKPHHLSWSLRWFASAGLDESNPVNLHTFAMRWMSFFSISVKALQSFRIVQD
jgi:hypothetical protein